MPAARLTRRESLSDEPCAVYELMTGPGGPSVCAVAGSGVTAHSPETGPAPVIPDVTWVARLAAASPRAIGRQVVVLAVR